MFALPTSQVMKIKTGAWVKVPALSSLSSNSTHDGIVAGEKAGAGIYDLAFLLNSKSKDSVTVRSPCPKICKEN